jgi:hypothetical protein
MALYASTKFKPRAGVAIYPLVRAPRCDACLLVRGESSSTRLPDKGRFYCWDTLIRLKAQEPANYTLGKQTGLDFSDPEPVLHSTDSEAIRNQIVFMTTAEARKRGIRKNTLWHLQQRARSDKPLSIYAKVGTKLP